MSNKSTSSQQLPLGKAETFKALFENATEGIMLVDESGEILMANPICYDLFGYEKGTLIGQKVEKLVPEKVHATHQSYRKDYFKHPKSRPMGAGMNLYAQRKDGSQFPVEISLSYFKDGDDVYAISFIIDITERKKQERLLVREREKAQKYLDVAGNMFVALKKDGTVDMVNRSGCEILGYEEQKIVGKNWFDHFIPERLREELKNVFNQILKGKIEPVEFYENPVLTKDKGERFIAFHNSVVHDDNGNVTGVLFSGEDITERKKTEDELKQANRELKRYAKELKRSNAELEQFAYVASHDLQEPLRMVSSYTQLLEKRYKDRLDKDANEFIEYAVDGAKRMQKLINDLLQFSRVGRDASSFEQVDLGEVIKIVRNNLRKLIGDTQAQINVNTKLPTIKADKTQMIQLFQNMINNGIKFRGKQPPEISINVQEKQQAWQFSVQDNGIGIEKTHQQRVFMIFQRLHNRHEYPGSGIGLALCKKIIERHDGQIWLDSKKGKGTTFYFTIAKDPEE